MRKPHAARALRAQVVREANLLEAGGRLPASVRALSGGDPDEPTEEVIASSTAQQLQLGVSACLVGLEAQQLHPCMGRLHVQRALAKLGCSAPVADKALSSCIAS